MVTVRQTPAWLDMCLDGFAAIAGGDAVLTWRVVFQIGPSPMQMRLSRFAPFLVATRGRKVDCLARRDQTCCAISSILRRCAERERPVQSLRTRSPQSPE